MCLFSARWRSSHTSSICVLLAGSAALLRNDPKGLTIPSLESVPHFGWFRTSPLLTQFNLVFDACVSPHRLTAKLPYPGYSRLHRYCRAEDCATVQIEAVGVGACAFGILATNSGTHEPWQNVSVSKSTRKENRSSSTLKTQAFTPAQVFSATFPSGLFCFKSVEGTRRW